MSKIFRVDMDQPLKNFRGEQLMLTPAYKDEAGTLVPAVPAKLGDICGRAFFEQLEEDKRRTDPAQILRDHMFAAKVSGGIVDLDMDDLNRVRTRIAKMGFPLVVAGAALTALDAAPLLPAAERA